jgi:F0F1-type ATP synthase membrane subunit b/b'
MDQELVQYLDQRFGRIEQRLDRHDQRFEQIDGRFNEVNERIEEVKRHSGVLVEGLRHELELVAEGFAMHIQVQHVQEREYHDRQHQETRALIRSFADDLRQQHDHLRHRVENLERPKPN